MIAMDVKNDQRVAQWFELSEIAEATRHAYLVYMQQFCDCIGKSPSELIDEAIREIKEGKLLSERKTIEYIVKFKQCMKDKAPKTQTLALSTIKSFYKAFDIEISSKVGKTKKRLPLREHQHFLTKEDVKNLIVNAKNLRAKAMILCMATSGMGKNEISNLRINDISIEPDGVGIISIRREKSQTDYTTFLSPEATIALKNYFKERERDPETKISSDNDFVFVTYEHGRGSKAGSQIASPTFTKSFRDLGRELGYGNGKGLFVKSRSHSLRKFFATTLENAGMPKNRVDYMLGHTPSGNDFAYFQHDINKLKEMYRTYLPYLTFEKEIKVHSLNSEDAKMLEELKVRNEALEAQVIALQGELGKQDNDASMYKDGLEKRYEEFEDRMCNYISNILKIPSETVKKDLKLKAQP